MCVPCHARLPALVCRLIFWQCDFEISGIQNRIGALFFLCVFYSLTSMSCLGIFVAERRMYLREYAAGTPLPVPSAFASTFSCPLSNCVRLAVCIVPPMLPFDHRANTASIARVSTRLNSVVAS